MTDTPDDLTGLFLPKKKKSTGNPLKKNKIETEDDSEQTVEIIRKTASTTESTSSSFLTSEMSKIDYSITNPTSVPVPEDSATAINEFDTEFERDHLTRRKDALERSRALASKRELDTTYRGLKGYQQFLMQGDTAKANAGSDKNRVAGPVRAAANLRVTCRFDYKPDLCKDYNETGFCGFGDSCIFLHDRTEHKSSYQLEQEWEAEQKRKHLDTLNADSLVPSNSSQAKLKPTSCSVCRGPFVSPVKTKCDHFFCEKCVFKLKKCPVCNAQLLGSFKPASKELNDNK